jgi:hypothetical protein
VQAHITVELNVGPPFTCRERRVLTLLISPLELTLGK